MVTENVGTALMEKKPAEVNLPVLVKGDGTVLMQSKRLALSKTQEAERRLKEAQLVNSATYAELEYVYNESYRELKANLAVLGYDIAIANKIIDQAKAEALFDRYPVFLEGRPKSFDNAEVRKSFVHQDPEYIKALDHLNTLKMLEALFDGKIKTMERVTAYMKKQVDILIKTGQMPNYVK